MSHETRPEIPELAKVLAGAMPALPPDQQELALAIYRQLAAGEPVSAGALAEQLSREEGEIANTLEQWPGVFFTDDGRVVGFWGLALAEMPHRFQVGGRTLHTWCAWDALFIPELIGQRAEVESRSPVSGEPVHLTVSPQGVEDVTPEATAVSMLAPTEVFDADVIMSFCHYVHFFTSAEEAAPWLSEHPGTFLLSVNEAFELGRVTNRARFGRALSELSGSR